MCTLPCQGPAHQVGTPAHPTGPCRSLVPGDLTSADERIERTGLSWDKSRVELRTQLESDGAMIDIEHESTGTVCRLKGELDASTVHTVRRTLDMLGGIPRLIIDVSMVEFIDSAGLGALVRAIRTADRAGGRIIIVCDRRSLLRLFETVGFDRIAVIEPDLTSALRELDRLPAGSKGSI